MARYYPVSPLFWMDEDVTQLDDRGKLLSLYLLTCEHRNLEGLFRLPITYMAEDLGWENRTITAQVKKLQAVGFIGYDTRARVVFLPRALKYHQPKTKPQIQGAINDLQAVPETELWPDFLSAAETFAPDLHAALMGI